MASNAIRLVKNNDKTDKGKALEAALSQIDRAFGKGSVMKLGERPDMDIEAIPTGSLGLDIALGIGGLPRGRVVETWFIEVGDFAAGSAFLAAGDAAVDRLIGLMARLPGQPERAMSSRLTGADGSVHLPGDPRDATALAEATAFVAERLGIAGAVTRSTSQHLSGAARIGEVCDDSGRVLGVVGVRVADASVLPSLPRCGPYYTVLAVAEDLAVRMATERAW